MVDLTGLDIGSTIRVSDLKLPDTAQAALPADSVVASIAAASAMVEEDAAADAATAEGAVAEAAETAAAEEGGEE